MHGEQSERNVPLNLPEEVKAYQPSDSAEQAAAVAEERAPAEVPEMDSGRPIGVEGGPEARETPVSVGQEELEGKAAPEVERPEDAAVGLLLLAAAAGAILLLSSRRPPAPPPA